jgi:predicted phosphoribosyltransferase
MLLPFRDRTQAGQLLAAELKPKYANLPNVVVLALPRGGVPVAFEIARELRAPLDVLIVRKLGVPGQEELALGAIASGGARVLNQDLVESLKISDRIIDSITAREQQRLQEREQAYRDGRPPYPVSGHIVILVDDGLATGATMLAAIRAVRTQKPERIIVAVPVAAPRVYESFLPEVDDIICLATPQPFLGVGQWYEDFSQVSDQQVRNPLEKASEWATTEARR